MKAVKSSYLLLLLLVCFSFTSCNRNRDEVWDDSKSAGRHMSRGIRTLGGKQGDSRAVYSRDDFMPNDDQYYYEDNSYAPPMNNEFIPLQDQYNPQEMAIGEYINPQPRETPGDPGSSIPGIEAFRDPSMNPSLAGVFRNIYFDYNSNLVKGRDNLDIARDVARYMRSSRNTYVFVEGHCDERGPEAYNLSLGSQRSNAVRNLLIQEGVSPDNIFTISYGKERPLIHEHNEEAWAQNRRVEFKVYQR